MKLPKPKKVLIVLATTTAVIAVGTPALAFSIGDTLSEFIAAQQTEVFGVPTSKIAGYIKNGKVNINTIFTDASKQAYDLIKGSIGVKTAGEQMADLNQDKNEIAQQVNTESTANNSKFFDDNVQRVQQTVAANETESDSSLEATSKSNKLFAANVQTNQQLTKVTSDLAIAQQNQNSMELEKGQLARVDRLKGQINSSFADNENQRLQVVPFRRFYRDGAGNMVEGRADASTRFFSRR